MTSNPSRGVKIAFKTQFLLAGNHVGILGVHVFRGWRNLLLTECSVQLRRVRKVDVVSVETSGVSIALEYSGEAVRQKRLGRGESVYIGLPRVLLGR
jgi:hypothetical protein